MPLANHITFLGVDPGPTSTAWCSFDPTSLTAQDLGHAPNHTAFPTIVSLASTLHAYIAIEWLQSFGVGPGQSLLRTAFEIGRLTVALDKIQRPYVLCLPATVKNSLCRSPHAKLSIIRASIIDRIGPVGSKSSPGPLYHLRGKPDHVWHALAVAIFAADNFHSLTSPNPAWHRFSWHNISQTTHH